MDVIWHKRAIFRVREIYNYYHANNKSTSSGIVDDIQKAVDSLCRFPYMASVELSIANSDVVYRSLIVRRRYKIIYYIEERDKIINIVTVWDCRKNPVEIMNDI